MLSEAELIKGCISFNRTAQKELYSKYSGKMRGICLRYCSNTEEAHDILQEGFMKVFTNIEKYSGSGSLEGWIRRIIVNTAISFYNKRKKLPIDIMDEVIEVANPSDLEDENDSDNGMEMILQAELSKEELLDALNVLNHTYRLVFNMYYLENYSHKEIAELLKIDEKTSRTRLFRGRKQLQKHIYSVCENKVKQFPILNHSR